MGLISTYGMFHLINPPQIIPHQEPDSETGALVSDVAPLSAAAAAGVKVEKRYVVFGNACVHYHFLGEDMFLFS